MALQLTYSDFTYTALHAIVSIFCGKFKINSNHSTSLLLFFCCCRLCCCSRKCWCDARTWKRMKLILWWVMNITYIYYVFCQALSGAHGSHDDRRITWSSIMVCKYRHLLFCCSSPMSCSVVGCNRNHHHYHHCCCLRWYCHRRHRHVITRLIDREHIHCIIIAIIWKLIFIQNLQWYYIFWSHIC